MAVPLGQKGNYQTLTREREISDSTKYMTINSQTPIFVKESTTASDAVVYQDIPPLPPRPEVSCDFTTSSRSESVKIHSEKQSTANQKNNAKVGNKKVFLITGAVFAVCLLISIASLLYGVFSTTMSDMEQESSQQLLQNSSSVIRDLTARVKLLENSLEQIQLCQQNETGFNDTEYWLLTNISSLQSRMSALERNLNVANSRLANSLQQIQVTQHNTTSLQSRTSNLVSNLNFVNSSLRQSIDSIQSILSTTNNQLTASNNRLRATSSDLSRLRSSLGRVNLFSRCVKQEYTCPVVQHSSAASHWYLCRTRPQRINVPVSSFC